MIKFIHFFAIYCNKVLFSFDAIVVIILLQIINDLSRFFALCSFHVSSEYTNMLQQ